MKESDLLYAIKQWLDLQKIFFWRNNTGGFIRDGHFYRFGKVGSSDIFCLKDGKLYAIELKSGKGKLTTAQLEFLAQVEKNGGVAIVARKLEDVEKLFKAFFK